MKTTVNKYRGFSCPQEELDENFLSVIAVEYAREFIRLFVERYRRELDDRGRGLSQILVAWVEGGERSCFDTVWDLAFAMGRLSVLRHAPKSALQRAGALGLRLQQSSVRGDWTADLGTSTRLLCGDWLLPKADWLSVASDERRFFVRVKRHGAKSLTVVFQRTAAGWKAEGAEQLPSVKIDRHRISLLCSPALDYHDFGLTPSALATEPPEEILAECRRAISILRRHAPIYLPWVDRVVRHIVPVRSDASMIRSGSDFDLPGTIQMSFGTSAVAVAEMLVHEASHQYFSIISRLDDVEDGSDPKLYYSPVRRMRRPIYNILMAYHAFANVVLFYRLCRASGLEDGGYCRQNEEETLPQLKQLEKALRATTALTPLGRALWEPLAARIN